MKKLLILALMGAFLAVGVSLYAGGYKKQQACKHQKECWEAKFFKKIKLIWLESKELDIEDGQMTAIKDLKVAAKKSFIEKKAAIELIVLDIKRELWNDSIDKDKIYNLIDKKYEIKKAKAKTLIDAHVKLKDILSEKQQEKLMDLCKTKKKQQCLLNK